MSHIIFLYLFTLANYQQTTEIVYKTTADKITMSYIRGGSTLPASVENGHKFAMNGQMYKTPNYQPVGLYIENGKKKNDVRIVDNPNVNFGITPQAVFYIDTNSKAGLVDVKKCNSKAYKYATQIAPMLLMNGEVNEKIKNFKGLCKNRNGIGITKNGGVVFLFAPNITTLPEFAGLFKKYDCITAAYVDGSVSEYWTPGKETYRTFGVVIKSK